MKRMLAILLSLLMAVSLSACQKEKTKNNDVISVTTSEIKHTGKKIDGEITGASVFSEGLAFVCLDGNQEKTYCIDKNGYIVFELDKKLVVNGRIENKFVNGLTIIDNALCDAEGNLTEPQEVGATRFYAIALKGGYILAEKITSDYSSSKKELGVMNKNFEWVVSLSESLYESVSEDLYSITAVNTECYYSDKFIYFYDSGKYLNLENGELSDSASVPLPSEKWISYDDNTFRDYNENIILDLSQHSNATLLNSDHYVNGKASISFFNQETGMYYFTVIDEKGEFLFDPVEVKNMQIDYLDYDGENVLISDSGVKKMQCYNSKGELLGELETESIEKNKGYSCDIGDGIITVHAGYNSSHNCYYYNTDFSTLLS